jgi:hypothetical protein
MKKKIIWKYFQQTELSCELMRQKLLGRIWQIQYFCIEKTLRKISQLMMTTFTDFSTDT